METKTTLEIIFFLHFVVCFVEAQILDIFCGGSSTCQKSIAQCDKFLQEALQIDLNANDVSTTLSQFSSPSQFSSQSQSPSSSQSSSQSSLLLNSTEGNSTLPTVGSTVNASEVASTYSSTNSSIRANSTADTSVTSATNDFDRCQTWTNIFNKCAIDIGIEENAITLNNGVDPCRNIGTTNCTTKNSVKKRNFRRHGHKGHGPSKHQRKRKSQGQYGSGKHGHNQRFKAHGRGHEKHGRKHGRPKSWKKDQRESHGRKDKKGKWKEIKKEKLVQSCNVFGPDQPENEESFVSSLRLNEAENFRKCKLEASGFIKNDSTVNYQRLQTLSGKFIKDQDLQTKIQLRINEKSCNINLVHYKIFDYLKCIAEPCLRPT